MINYYWCSGNWLYLYLAVHIRCGNYCYSGHIFIGSLTLCDQDLINTETLKIFSDPANIWCRAKLSTKSQGHDKSTRVYWQTDDNRSKRYLCFKSALSLIPNPTISWSRHDGSYEEVGHLTALSVLVCILCVLFIHEGCYTSVRRVKLYRWIDSSGSAWGNFHSYNLPCSSSWWLPWQKLSQWVRNLHGTLFKYWLNFFVGQSPNCTVTIHFRNYWRKSVSPGIEHDHN